MTSDRDKYSGALNRQRTERDQATKQPIPYRITQALDFRMLYGPEVDRALGGEEPMVDLWESGDLVPTPEQVRLLAELTQFPVRYFYLEVKQPGGWAWSCSRGPGGGCERVWMGPPEPPVEPEPEARVIPLFGQKELW